MKRFAVPSLHVVKISYPARHLARRHGRARHARGSAIRAPAGHRTGRRDGLVSALPLESPADAEAFTPVYFLERACAMRVATQGGTVRLPADPVQAVVEQQSQGLFFVADLLVWPALLRKLDRVNPGYAA
ncbi:hypothetical protein ACRAWD_30455 [Caulobacter segnis]